MDVSKKVDVFVAGAGIAGLAAAQELQAKGLDYLIAEKNLDPGGLTRSIYIGEACFDYTGHFLHLARCSSPAAIPYARQSDEDWQTVTRKSAVYVNGSLIPAPFQYNLFYLPEAVREQCMESFRTRPKRENLRSFKEYLMDGFGRSMCDNFLFPYNEKSMACSLEDLSVDSVKRFFPLPDSQKIEKGYIQEGVNQNTGYNMIFWYPKKGGIGLLTKGLARGLKSLQTRCPVEKVNLVKKYASTPFGEIHYKKMITSLPLKEFCTLTTDPSLQALADSLSHNRVFCLNILMHASVPKHLEDLHWIYLPEKSIPFYRLGIYSNISSRMNPSGYTAFYLEVAFSHNSPLPPLSSLLDKIFPSLERLGWAKRSDCRVISAHWIDCAYVHFAHDRQEVLNRIFNTLQKYDVFPIGRYGLWDYISMEDTILSSLETARRVAAMEKKPFNECFE